MFYNLGLGNYRWASSSSFSSLLRTLVRPLLKLPYNFHAYVKALCTAKYIPRPEVNVTREVRPYHPDRLRQLGAHLSAANGGAWLDMRPRPRTLAFELSDTLADVNLIVVQVTCDGQPVFLDISGRTMWELIEAVFWGSASWDEIRYRRTR